MKTLFCILGRSASGKDSLAREVCKQLNLKSVISCTTRPPRAKDEDTHLFKTLEDYLQDSTEQNVAAHTKIGEYYYWVTYSQLKENDIYIIDPEGLDTLNLTGSDIRIVTIYITAPEKMRYQRALMRTPNAIEDYNTRVSAENIQFSLYEHNQTYDYCVHNIHFYKALEQLKNIIIFEKELENAF